MRFGPQFDESTRVWVLHAWGPVPGDSSIGWEGADRLDTLFTYVFPDPNEREESSDSESLNRVVEDNGYIYHVWSTRYKAVPTPNVYISKIATNPVAVVDSAQQLNPPSTHGANVPRLWKDEDSDTFHLIYHERPRAAGFFRYEAGTDTSRIYHQYTMGDPADSAGWSTRTDVTSSRRTAAFGGRLVAREDSVWIVYGLHDDDLGADADSSWQVWARNGWAVGDTIPADSSTTWSGDVFLDADFVVAEDGTLTVAAGTRVHVEPKDQRNAGVDTKRIELIARGTLRIEGTDSLTVTFRSTTQDTADWYGIRTWNNDYTENPRPFSHVTISNALNGITLEGFGSFPDLATLESSNDMDLSGCVNKLCLAKDYTVASGDSLVIPAGWTLAFPEGRDADSTSGRTELVIASGGKLRIEGEEGNEAGLRCEDPASTGTSDWAGIRFEGTTDQSQCDISYVEISNAFRGVQVDSLGGNLFHPSFVSNEADVFLGTDTMVDSGYVWALDGPTRVVADTVSAHDWPWGSTAGEVDLIVRGKLYTSGSADPGDTVYFAPADTSTEDNFYLCEDWGGVGLYPGSEGSVLAYADIGFASNPLFLNYADSLTTVEHSRIHHFADVGIWAYGASGVGGVIYDCTIERGSGTDTDLGATGAFLDQTDAFRFSENEVDLAGLDENQIASGVLAKYGKTYCQTASAGSDTLTIDGNTITGGWNGTGDGEHVGMKFEWVCGESDREVDVFENYVSGWSKYGVEMVQDSDLQFTCNNVESNPRAVHISRDEEAEGIGLRFRENRLVSLQRDNAVIRSDNAVKTRLGGPHSPADKGYNRLMRSSLVADSTFFMFEDDPTDTLLHAETNSWWTIGDSDSDRVATEQGVLDWIRPSDGDPEDADVLVDSLGVSLPTACYPPSPESEGVRAGRPREEAPDSRGSETSADLALPSVTSLGLASPNPVQGSVGLALAVSAERGGVWTARVYDVGGRRVATLFHGLLEPGHHTVVWSGRNRGGNRVSPGVYFLHVEGPNWQATRKVVRLR